jgi:uncharacterized protein (DUF433 family)
MFAELGKGVYPLAEVARYTSTPKAIVRAWFRGRSDGAGRGPVFHSDYEPRGNDYAVSFLDMIDLLVAARFRNEGVNMGVIRRAANTLAHELQTNHPFSHRSLFTDGKRIITLAADEVGDESLYDVLSRQMFFLQLKDGLKHMDYGTTSRLAERWYVSQGVVIDPRCGRGKPVVQSTGLSTFVLANQYWANNNDSALVADLYNVSEKDVMNAVSFEEGHGRRAAA